MNTLLDTLFHLTTEIRYVSIYSAGTLFIRQRPDSLHASASDSDRYKELLVNPTLLQVKVVFVDEAQHLLTADPRSRPTTQLDWLKTLANRTNVLHVLVGNFDLYACCHLNGQAVRRMRDHHFPRYHLDAQKECEEFVGVLKSSLERVPLTVDVPALLSHWRWFGEWSVGCVRVLGDWIVETVDALWSASETVLTVEALTNHALQLDQQARLEMEARTGEHKVARGKAQSELELQQLLGTANTTVPTLGRSTTRIERDAQRDPVEDVVPVGNAFKCPFTSHSDIPFQRFLDSGTARVECPECGALRQVPP